MQYEVDVTRNMDIVGHIAADQPELYIWQQVRDVVRHSGEEIVQADDLDAMRQQALAQMGAEETRATRDDRSPEFSGRRRSGHSRVSMCTLGRLSYTAWIADVPG